MSSGRDAKVFCSLLRSVEHASDGVNDEVLIFTAVVSGALCCRCCAVSGKRLPHAPWFSPSFSGRQLAFVCREVNHARLPGNACLRALTAPPRYSNVWYLNMQKREREANHSKQMRLKRHLYGFDSQ